MATESPSTNLIISVTFVLQPWAVPFRTVISGGFTPGKKITIEGAVHPNADRFTVDLCTGSVVALHYNPRFSENTVVRNTKKDCNWGQAERGGPMPFQRGQDFTMEIHCESECFRIVVNGVQVHEYNHRHKELDQINALEIYRDVTLRNVIM